MRLLTVADGYDFTLERINGHEFQVVGTDDALDFGGILEQGT